MGWYFHYQSWATCLQSWRVSVWSTLCNSRWRNHSMAVSLGDVPLYQVTQFSLQKWCGRSSSFVLPVFYWYDICNSIGKWLVYGMGVAFLSSFFVQRNGVLKRNTPAVCCRLMLGQSNANPHRSPLSARHALNVRARRVVSGYSLLLVGLWSTGGERDRRLQSVGGSRAWR